MRARLFLVVGLSLLAVGFGTAGILFAGAVETGWLTLGGNFQRTGLSQDSGPVQGGIQWKFETGGAVVSSATVGFDGQIHVACEDGKLYTLSKTGEPKMVADVNTPLVSAPTIGPDGSLYVGGKDGRLWAIAPDGSVQWTWQTGDAIYAAPALASNGSLYASSSGDIYVGSTDGTLYALRQDGTELWRFRTKGPGALLTGAIFASPALAADGTVYVAGMYDPNLYALNPADGSIKWVCRFPPDSEEDEIGGWPFAAPVVAGDGTIYQTLLYDRHLYAISPDTGAIRWSVDLCDPRLFGPEKAAELEGGGWSEPALGPDGTIYVSLDDPYLRAVDPSGTVKWVTQLGEVGGFTLTVDKTGLIYAASDDGYVYVVSPGSLLVAQFETGGWPVFPVLAANDLLILADSKDYSGYAEGAKNAVWAISSESLSQLGGPVRRQ